MTTLLQLVAVALQALNLFTKLRMYQVKHISLHIIFNAMTQRWLAYVSLGNSAIDSTLDLVLFVYNKRLFSSFSVLVLCSLCIAKTDV